MYHLWNSQCYNADQVWYFLHALELPPSTDLCLQCDQSRGGNFNAGKIYHTWSRYNASLYLSRQLSWWYTKEQRKPYAIYNGNIASEWDQWYNVMYNKVWQIWTVFSFWSCSELCSLWFYALKNSFSLFLQIKKRSNIDLLIEYSNNSKISYSIIRGLFLAFWKFYDWRA